MGGTHIGVTFTDWDYSSDTEDVREYIGAEVTTEGSGITLKVGETTISNGNVLFGDVVTVNITAENGKEYTVKVDGTAIKTVTENGTATATFTVTKKTHSVTYSFAYAIMGTVTGGDANTEITVSTADGTALYTGKGASFNTALGNGTYIVTAQSATKVGRKEFTVSNQAVDVTVSLDKHKITGETAQSTPVFDAATGYYTLTESVEYSGYFAEPSVNGDPFLLTATVKQFNESYMYNRVAGFAVQTANGFVRLALVRDQRNNYYAGISDVNGADAIIYELPNDMKNPSGETVNIALAYNGGTYYFFVNKTLAYTVTGYDAPSGKVGLGGTHIGVTFTDWDYSTDATELREYIGASVTAENFTVKVGDTAVTNGKVLLGDVVTVSMSITEGQNIGLMLDGNAVRAESADGMLTYTFTVTKAVHTVTYSATYDLTIKTTAGATVSIFAADSATPSETGTADASGYYTVALPNGTYKATASSETKLSVPVSVTVNGAAANVTVALDKHKITGETAQNTPVFDAATGYYTLTESVEYSGYFAEPSVNGDPFLLTATVKQFNESYMYNRVAGFAVQTANGFVRLALVRDQRNNYYAGISDVNGADAIIYELPNDMKNPSGETVNIALAYNGGTYYFFVNKTLAYTVTGYDAPSGKVGLGGTHIGVTFTDWDYSSDTEDVREYIGAEVTTEGSGITLKVGETTISNGNVLFGDVVTVNITAENGKEYTVKVDGTAIKTVTENGTATATFTVTKKTHSVTYSFAYAIMGTVTGGDANTEIMVSTADGTVMYTGKGASFNTALGNGTYIVTAQGATKVGRKEFTVSNQAVDVTVSLDKHKITDATGASGHATPAYDAATGYYMFKEEWKEYSSYFAEPTVSGTDSFMLSATVKQFKDDRWCAVAGFTVQTGEGQFVRFALRWNKDATPKYYDGISWNTDNGVPNVHDKVEINSDTNDISLALVYNGGNYYFFVNNTLAYTVTGYDAPSGKVGLGGTHIGVTFTDWGYSTDISGYTLPESN